MNEPTPFFSNNASTTLPTGLDVVGRVELVKKTRVIGRNVEYPDDFVSSSTGFGLPGIPFIPGTPNPSNFCQGEDVLFDALLIYQGKPAVSENYNISATLKPSLRSFSVLWQGALGNGISKERDEGAYLIWIPSRKTTELFAGSYVLNISIHEPVGQGAGAHDKRISLIDVMFNIEYCGGSPNPESLKKEETALRRDNLEKSWPNAPSTVRG